jgi:ribosomal protein L6P/L9E
MGTLSMVLPSGLKCSVASPSLHDLAGSCPPELGSKVVEWNLKDLQRVRTEAKLPGKGPAVIKARHGTTGSLLGSMVQGVSEGFQRKLLLTGIGYRARLSGRGLELNVGYSHNVCIYPPSDLNVSLEGPTVVVVSGTRKDRVGDFAAKVRSVRPPEPYKGKGISYEGEVIRRKAGKSGKAGR